MRGGAPATRETDLLNPVNMVEQVNAIVLSGGSAFGLDAATGVVRWLEEHNIGFGRSAPRSVPIVPAAILFDLGVGGNPKIRPTADCGYQAPRRRRRTAPVAEGNVGAGAGATVGKIGGARPRDEGRASAARRSRCPTASSSPRIVAVNAVGDIIDPATGQGRRRRAQPPTASARRRAHAAAHGRHAAAAARRREHHDRRRRHQREADEDAGDRRSRRWPTTASRARSARRTRWATATRSSRSPPARWTGTADVTPIGALAAEVDGRRHRPRRDARRPASRDIPPRAI